jgi:hypothetical protein
MKPTPESDPGAPRTFDFRDLAPPGPLVRSLEEANRLAPGGVIVVRTRFCPSFLMEELERRGLRHLSREAGEMDWTTEIRRPAEEAEGAS